MTVERLDGGAGPDLWRVTTDDLALVFVPEVGGRLLSLEVGGRELLWRNPLLIDADFTWLLPRSSWPDGRSGIASWHNLGGSKSWPAPQGWQDPETQWDGPPDPVLDAGPYSWKCVETPELTTVEMQSAPDERSGMRITRRFDIPHTGRVMAETVTFTNISTRPRTWSIWEVVQVDTSALGSGTSGSAVIGVADDRVVDLGAYRGHGVVRREGDVAELPIVPGVAKRGFPSASGTIGYEEAGRRLLELSFTPEEGAPYPDGDSRAEVWMQSPQREPLAELGGLRPDAWLVELEVLSPLRAIGPGDAASLALTWRI